MLSFKGIFHHITNENRALRGGRGENMYALGKVLKITVAAAMLCL